MDIYVEPHCFLFLPSGNLRRSDIGDVASAWTSIFCMFCFWHHFLEKTSRKMSDINLKEIVCISFLISWHFVNICASTAINRRSSSHRLGIDLHKGCTTTSCATRSTAGHETTPAGASRSWVATMILMIKIRHQCASSRSSAASLRSSIASTGAKDICGHIMLPSKHQFWNRMRASRTSSSPSRTPCIMLDCISLHLCPCIKLGISGRAPAKMEPAIAATSIMPSTSWRTWRHRPEITHRWHHHCAHRVPHSDSSIWAGQLIVASEKMHKASETRNIWGGNILRWNSSSFVQHRKRHLMVIDLLERYQ